MDLEHPLSFNAKDLQELHQLVLALGALSLDQMKKAMQGFRDKDASMARQIVARDEEANDLERKVDRASLLLVTRMEPKAGDLRYVLSCGKVASDLERIADYAKNIASRSGRCMSADFVCQLSSVNLMGSSVVAMLEEILVAFEQLDVEKALAVRSADDKVDAVFKKGLTGMKDCVEGDDVDGTGAISLLFIMRCLERVGDHIKNIAEHIYFVQKGDYYIGQE